MNRKHNWTPTRILAAISAAAIVLVISIGLSWMSMAPAAGPVTGALSATAGSGGVTAKTFVKLSAANTIVASTAATDNVVGVCEFTAAANAITRYAPPGTRTTVTSGEAIAVGDLLTSGTSGYAYVLGTGAACRSRASAIALSAAAAAASDVDVMVIASDVGPKVTATAITGNVTLTANDSGKTYAVAADANATLPATVVGVTYTFYINAPAGTYRFALDPNASDKFIGQGITATDDKDYYSAAATNKRGDMVTVVGDGSLGWYIQRQVGTWARE
ncbi:MAG TPA: hypothetical protein VM238_07005 [Phycisphaerae bacterium]|nr:hypothetical protein [Phycisphaerae bacterium]